MIRMGDWEDIPFIIQCLQDMRREANFDAADDPKYVTGTLTQLFGLDAFSAFIIEDRAVALSITQGQWYDARLTTYEQLLYVKPEFRTGTLAVRLIEALVSDAKLRKSREIQAGSVTGFKEDALLRLYKRMGFEEYRGGVRLRLS